VDCKGLTTSCEGSVDTRYCPQAVPECVITAFATSLALPRGFWLTPSSSPYLSCPASQHRLRAPRPLRVVLLPAIAASMSATVCAAHPTVWGSRAGGRCRGGQRCPPLAAAGRELAALRAVADAALPAAEPLASSASTSQMKPCVEVFPAMIASRLTEDNRMFVEAHRSASRPACWPAAPEAAAWGGAGKY
jgi:hypothetical protein